jgi:hypothetical protein
MASPAAPAILSRVVVFAIEGSADRFCNKLPPYLQGEAQIERFQILGVPSGIGLDQFILMSSPAPEGKRATANA